MSEKKFKYEWTGEYREVEKGEWYLGNYGAPILCQIEIKYPYFILCRVEVLP